MQTETLQSYRRGHKHAHAARNGRSTIRTPVLSTHNHCLVRDMDVGKNDDDDDDYIFFLGPRILKTQLLNHQFLVTSRDRSAHTDLRWHLCSWVLGQLSVAALCISALVPWETRVPGGDSGERLQGSTWGPQVEREALPPPGPPLPSDGFQLGGE